MKFNPNEIRLDIKTQKTRILKSFWSFLIFGSIWVQLNLVYTRRVWREVRFQHEQPRDIYSLLDIRVVSVYCWKMQLYRSLISIFLTQYYICTCLDSDLPFIIDLIITRNHFSLFCLVVFFLIVLIGIDSNGSAKAVWKAVEIQGMSIHIQRRFWWLKN